jgi:hypothetical protein
MLRFLRATPKPVTPTSPEGSPIDISVSPGGRLHVRCDDDITYEWVTSLLAHRLFIQGRGFPRLKRRPDGNLERDPDTNRVVIDGYVDRSAPPPEVLEAIRDNLEVTGQFSLSWEKSEQP